jgi:hypothetical protein
MRFGNKETTMTVTNHAMRIKEQFQIDRDVKAFLRKGGKVKKIASGVFGQTDFAHGSARKVNKPEKAKLAN